MLIFNHEIHQRQTTEKQPEQTPSPAEFEVRNCDLKNIMVDGKPALLSYHHVSGTKKRVDKTPDYRHVPGICDFLDTLFERIFMGFVVVILGEPVERQKDQMLIPDRIQIRPIGP